MAAGNTGVIYELLPARVVCDVILPKGYKELPTTEQYQQFSAPPKLRSVPATRAQPTQTRAGRKGSVSHVSKASVQKLIRRD